MNGRTSAIADTTPDEAYLIGEQTGYETALEQLPAAADWVQLNPEERRTVATALRLHAADHIRYQQSNGDAWLHNDHLQNLARRIDTDQDS